MKNKLNEPCTARPESAPLPASGANEAGAVSPTHKQQLLQTIIDPIEVMKELKICRGTLYNWRKKGLVAFSKIGGRVYFEVSDLYRMFRETKQRNGSLLFPASWQAIMNESSNEKPV